MQQFNVNKLIKVLFFNLFCSLTIKISNYNYFLKIRKKNKRIVYKNKTATLHIVFLRKRSQVYGTPFFD